MKVACIVPIAALELVGDHTYHMALTHLTLLSPEYCTFYSVRKVGSILIQDNSAFELDRPCSDAEIKDAAEQLNPEIVVVPDSMWNPEENIYLARQYKEEAYKLRAYYPNLKFMGVPHGSEESEFLDNLQDLLRLGYIDIIGLPKTSARLDIRSRCAGIIADQGRLVHFLGVWDNPIGEVLEGKEFNASRGKDIVLGLDSSYPARLGIAGRTLLEYHPTPKAPDFFLPAEEMSMPWVKRQLDAFRFLAESDISSEEELKQEYKNGRF